MEQVKFLTQESPWLILLCIFVGLLYAFTLYQKKAVWSKNINYLLAALRFICVTIICILLLLNPIMRQITNTSEKPTVVFAIDNSLSIASNTDTAELKRILRELEATGGLLKNDDILIDIQYFGSENNAQALGLLQLPFNFPSSNLSQLLNTIRNNYENRNLDKVVLLTDGIYNQGNSPAYSNYGFPIFTVGMGDTTPKKDIRIQSVLANKIAYLGNSFPVVAEIENTGFPNRTVMAYLSQGGVIVDKKNISLKNSGDIEQVSFLANAKQKGMQHLTVSVDVLDGEFTAVNNIRDVYVEVIDGREKILVVALTPHPDIKALKSSIEKNENYSFDFHIPGINALKNEKYDLVIFHQIPNIQRVGTELITRFRQAGVPLFFILGNQTDVNGFNSLNGTLKITGRAGQNDKVSPILNTKFSQFNLDVNKAALFRKFPPVSVPFGEYSISNAAEVILKQRVGNIDTEKPLLIINQTNTEKTAVLAGEGIWAWRIEEYDLNENHDFFDEFINKVIQFLTTKEDKRKLRVYPINTEFYDFEKVVFETEIYNDIYERIYDTKINLSISNGKDKTNTYTFTPSEGNSRFEISGLSKGVYAYQATANVKGKAETVSGEFTVKDLQLESLSNTADHNLLKQVSEKSKGLFFLPNEMDRLQKTLLETRKPDVLHTGEEVKEMINLQWIFFLLLGLTTVEWFIRKYQGSY